MIPFDRAFISILVAYKFWRDDGLRLEDPDFRHMYEQIFAYERGWC